MIMRYWRSFNFTICPDFNLHIYDTTAAHTVQSYDRSSQHRTTMKVHKSIRGIPEGWTITDSHLSHDNER